MEPLVNLDFTRAFLYRIYDVMVTRQQVCIFMKKLGILVLQPDDTYFSMRMLVCEDCEPWLGLHAQGRQCTVYLAHGPGESLHRGLVQLPTGREHEIAGQT